MELKITRLTPDERFYLIDSGEGSSLGMQASELKGWLLDLGIGDSTIAAVLDMSPNETMLFKVEKRAA